MEGLKASMTTANPEDMCYACFNNAYPIEMSKETVTGADKYVFEQRAK